MFNQAPFVRYLFFLLTGIFSAGFFRTGHVQLVWAALAVILSVSLLLIIIAGTRLSKFLPVAVFGAIAGLGWTSATLQSLRFDKRLAGIESEDYRMYQARMTGLPEKRKNSLRYPAEITRLFLTDGEIKNVDSEALIYFAGDPERLPSAGESLIIAGRLKRPRQAASAYSFDYRSFLERKGIPWTGSVRSSGSIYRVSATGPAASFLYSPENLSVKSDQVFRKYIHDDDAYGFVKAMILGRRDDIRAELNDAFVSSGTVHILSVSGLHIAIFFSVLHFALGFLRKNTWGKYAYLFVMTSILAFYSVLTGLPASVQRATLMCMVWMIADTFSRKHHPVNTLAVSGFFILLADPGTFYDVGFQLSFLAMLGIFLWSKPIESLYRPQNRLLKHLWSLSVMSLAAQLMTFPLIVYYFNQLPVYFLLANLLAVDVAGILIPASFGLLLLELTGLGALAALAGHIVSCLAVFVNYIVFLPEKLPYHLIENIDLDVYQATMLLILIMAAYAAFVQRKLAAVKPVFIIACCFSLYSSYAVAADYRETFVRPVGRDFIYKSAGRMLHFSQHNEPDFFSAYEIRKYRARYGPDTVMVRVE